MIVREENVNHFIIQYNYVIKFGSSLDPPLKHGASFDYASLRSG